MKTLTRATADQAETERGEQVVLSERTAIICNPEFGVDDVGHVTLRFEAYIDEMTGAPQRLAPEQAHELLKAAGATDVSHLQGHPVWVMVSRDRIEYRSPWQANGIWDRRTVRA